MSETATIHRPADFVTGHPSKAEASGPTARRRLTMTLATGATLAILLGVGMVGTLAADASIGSADLRPSQAAPLSAQA